MKLLKQFKVGLFGLTRISAFLCILISSPLAQANGNSEYLDGNAILSKSDNFRSLGENFTFNIQLTDSKDRNRVLTVYIKDRTNGLVKLVSPSSFAGRSFLYLNKNIWQYSSSTGRAVRLQPQYQFLPGIDSLDLVNTGFSHDYKVNDITVSSSEILLELHAIERDFANQRVILKVNPKDFRPLEASFFHENEEDLSGAVPKKTIFYEEYREFNNNSHPTKIRIVNHEHNDDETIMRFSLMRKSDTPDEWFNPQFLERFN